MWWFLALIPLAVLGWFFRPFKSKAEVAFEFTDTKDGGTEVT